MVGEQNDRLQGEFLVITERALFFLRVMEDGRCGFSTAEDQSQ